MADSAKEYKGDNEYLDRVLALTETDEPVWRVNGEIGMRLIAAGTKEEALAEYKSRIPKRNTKTKEVTMYTGPAPTEAPPGQQLEPLVSMWDNVGQKEYASRR